MKESCEEQSAIDFGHEPYAGSGDAPGVAWVGGDATRDSVEPVGAGL